MVVAEKWRGVVVVVRYGKARWRKKMGSSFCYHTDTILQNGVSKKDRNLYMMMVMIYKHNDK